MIALLGHFAVAFGIGCAGCARVVPIAGPDEGQVLQASVAAPSDSACRVVQVQLLAGGPNVLFPNRATCGAGLTLIPGGAPTLGAGDNRVVKIPLRVLNKTADSLVGPIRVIFTPGAVEVIGSGSPSDVDAHLADSLLAGGRILWLISPSHPVVAGDSTEAKQITIRLGSPTADAKVALGVEAMAEGGFPGVAPDTKPAWFQDDSSWTALGTLKRIVVVRFKAGTPVAERRMAVDSVGGSVVGGHRTPSENDGFYYILVPGAVTEDAILDAVDILKRQSAVDHAGTAFHTEPAWRRPNDGAGWNMADWAIDPDASAGENWWLEEVRAPLAWGCETIAEAAPITVIEHAFRVGPFLANVEGGALPQQPLLPYLPQVLPRHGMSVANIIADPGDDGEAGAGMAWNARLRLIALGRNDTPDLIRDRIIEAAQGGSKVINLSNGHGLTGNARTDTSRVQDWRRFIREAIDTLPPAVRPLLVVAAGNQRRNVAEVGLNGIATDFPGNIIIVAASGPRSGTSRDRWGGSNFTPCAGCGSNHGALVDVYAPGDSLFYWEQITSQFMGPISGTSLSAPIVSGLAGLMMQMDPALTPAEVKGMVLSAAQERGVQMVSHQGKYLVDAYGALKKVAERPNTPLCGNRVWSESGFIRAQRGTATENLFPIGGPVTYVRVRHGGYRVDVFDRNLFDRRAFVFGNGQWTETSAYDTTAVGYAESLSGAAVSVVGLSHDLDSAAAMVWMGNAGGLGRWRIKVVTAANPNGTFIGPEITRPYGSTAGDSVCLHQRRESCLEWGFPGSGNSWGPTGGYSPMGDRLVIALSQQGYSTTIGSIGPCPWTTIDTMYADDQCAAKVTSLRTTGNSDVLEYLLTAPNAAPRPVGGLSGLSVWDIAISEDGREVATQAGRQPSSLVVVPDSLPWLPWKVSSSTGGAVDCEWQYYKFPTGADSLPTPATIPLTFGCEEYWSATFAPRKQGVDRMFPRIP